MAGLYSCVLHKRGRELLCVLDELGELGGVNFEDFLYCFLGSASHQGENSTCGRSSEMVQRVEWMQVVETAWMSSTKDPSTMSRSAANLEEMKHTSKNFFFAFQASCLLFSVV